MELKFAELHTPAFVAGTNLGIKLLPASRTGLKLQYDRKEKELHIYWNGEVGIVPYSNVVCMIEGNHTETLVEAKRLDNKPQMKTSELVHGVINAQVSTPLDHVFGGEGKGVTGQEKKKIPK
jgi:hypothetical protein